jgi:hypothetical protein
MSPFFHKLESVVILHEHAYIVKDAIPKFCFHFKDCLEAPTGQPEFSVVSEEKIRLQAIIAKTKLMGMITNAIYN